MNKIWYKLIFKQISPIHIGMFNYGVLSETRIFIPGWTMWGALVNRYGQYRGGKEELFEEGKQIFESITCFYPKLGTQNKILFPKFENGDFYLGNYSENEFRAKFTDIYVSTAIQPSSLTAKEESLHEIEVILPESKILKEEKDKSNFYWIGLLGIDNDKAEEIKDFLEKGLDIIVGGDSRYGLGNMKLEKLYKATERDLSEWFITENREPKFESKPLRNYFAITDGFFKELKESNRIFDVGRIEHVITQLNFSKVSPKIEESKICIAPGSVIKENKECNYKLKKGIFQI